MSATMSPGTSPSMSRSPETGTPRRRYAPRARQALALGSLAATATLAGCGEPAPENRLFTSVDNCISAGFSEAVCEGEYQTALQRHAAEAPRFDDQAVCEAEFGEDRCTEVAPGTPAAGGASQSFFMPFLTGYLVSSALSRVGSYAAYNTFLRSNPSYRPDPIYRSRAGVPVTVGRDAVTNRPTVRPVNQNTRTVARRGFGGRGFGRGFGG